ncbi:hypothetical protein CEXT_669061 [Caerostris extrusa]|uniref:Uncharacterized protein n=1 Tax=Caerostris extrusa TaxID=172846 RepID=A0AAV4MBK6_CAEEX|nr:hypothetical protein CEXT_669061 [Caerostris extrusa]
MGAEPCNVTANANHTDDGLFVLTKGIPHGRCRKDHPFPLPNMPMSKARRPFDVPQIGKFYALFRKCFIPYTNKDNL